jgi:hypothetical protein
MVEIRTEGNREGIQQALHPQLPMEPLFLLSLVDNLLLMKTCEIPLLAHFLLQALWEQVLQYQTVMEKTNVRMFSYMTSLLKANILIFKW